MTDQQVLRYTQLCKRRMDILLHSGASWLPEYEAELKSIDQELKELSEARERLNCIVSLAQKYNVAVVIICHFNKNGKGDAITRVMGSTDIMGICRSYIALGNVPGEEDIKYMSHEKSSLERKGKTILFEIDPDRGGIVYVGESV